MNDETIHKVRGSVMVEFAGALLLLVTLVFGISEVGRAIHQLNTLTKSVEAGARYLSRTVALLEFDPFATSAAEQCNISSNWNNAELRARNIILFGTETPGVQTRLPNMDVTSITVEARIDNGLASGGACVIKVRARAKFVPIFSDGSTYPKLYGEDEHSSEHAGLTLTAETQERYIGE